MHEISSINSLLNLVLLGVLANIAKLMHHINCLKISQLKVVYYYVATHTLCVCVYI